MADCDIADLASDSTCFYAASEKQLLQIAVWIVCQINNGETVSCDIDQLAEDSTCFSAADTKTLLQMLVYSLCQISSGGGGLQQVFSGNYGGGTPTDTPTASSAFAYDLDGPAYNQWVWNGSSWQ